MISFLLANVTAGNCHGDAQQSKEQIRYSNCNSRHFNKLAHSGGVRVLLHPLIVGWKDENPHHTCHHKYYYNCTNGAAGKGKNSNKQHISFISEI